MSAPQIHTLTVSMKLDKTSSWETLRFEGLKFTVPQGTSHYVICYISQQKNKRRAEIPATTSSHLQLHALITCNSGRHLAGNSELFPV